MKYYLSINKAKIEKGRRCLTWPYSMEEYLWMATSPGTDEEVIAALTDPDLAEIYNLGHRFLSITHFPEYPTPINIDTKTKNVGADGICIFTYPATNGDQK